MADAKSIAKTKESVKVATHPKYNEMIATAIETLKEKKGSSRAAIIKFITSKYKVSDNPNVVNNRVKLALKKGVESGVLTQVKGSGASGSFKLSKKAVATPNDEKVTFKAVKSPKKAEAKKSVKSPKKATKSPQKPKAVKSPKKAKSPKTVAKSKPKAEAKIPTKKAAKPKAKSTKK